jgi:RNA polymerase subunit RPABC4/transcription elongation factor Spt4
MRSGEIMQVRAEQRTRFSDELRLIPGWAWVLAGIGFVTAHLVFDFVMANDPKAPRLWVRILMAIGAGTVVGCYLLLIGYINRDAGRRGMSRLAWTLLAIFVPNGLGIVLYFILRQALPTLCGRCAARVHNGYSYCPHCGESLTPQCPHCHHAIHAGDEFCPFCGKRVHAATEISTTPAHS